MNLRAGPDNSPGGRKTSTFQGIGPVNTPDPPDSYLTCAGEGCAETKVQRSRFLAVCRPVASGDAIDAALEEIRRDHHDARHLCYGWKVGVGLLAAEKRQDDGEPAGTAGEPILVAIRRAGLTDVLVAVVRWFGGVKLGTGGLARAYGEAAEASLAAAGVREVLLGRHFLLNLPYAQQKTVSHLLGSHGGRVTDQQYAEEVTWRIWLPHSTWRGFAEALTETSGGTLDLVEITDGE